MTTDRSGHRATSHKYNSDDVSGQECVQSTRLYFVILVPSRPQYFWSALTIANNGKASGRAGISKNAQRGERNKLYIYREEGENGS